MADETSDELLRRTERGVLWLTINRADRGNALAWYVRNAMIDAFEQADSDPAIRCIVLSGAGERHFCTGADLTVPNPPKPRPDGAPELVAGELANIMRDGFPKLVRAVQACAKPVLVALNGTAAGGGAALVLAADLVIAVEHARIVQVFVRRGLVADSGVTYLLPQLVGMHKAKELLFFGDDLSAEDAERLGIVNKVVPAGEFATTVQAWAERLGSGPTRAIGFTKRLLHSGARSTLAHLLDDEATFVEVNQGTVDSREGVQAFRERRDPEWRGW
jgi:2-(1,2-epoxy-1,2-dihydrophenyl)acetyl-CoA isomerase